MPNYPHQSRSLKPPNCTSTSLPFSRVREPKSSLKLHLSPAIPSSLLQTHHRCCCIRFLLTSQPLLILYSLFKESKSCLLCWCCSFFPFSATTISFSLAEALFCHPFYCCVFTRAQQINSHPITKSFLRLCFTPTPSWLLLLSSFNITFQGECHYAPSKPSSMQL